MLSRPPPKLMLITPAPLRAASTSDAITLELVRSLFSRISRQSNPAPAIPTPLSVARACEPARRGCRGRPRRRSRPSSRRGLRPIAILAARSGWAESMPESMMPTRAPVPRLRSQAAGKSLAVQVPLVGLPADAAGPAATSPGRSARAAAGGGPPAPRPTTRGSRSSRAASSAIVSPAADARSARPPRAPPGPRGAGRGGRSPREPGRAPRPSPRARAVEQHERAAGGRRSGREPESRRPAQAAASSASERPELHPSESRDTAGGQYRFRRARA